MVFDWSALAAGGAGVAVGIGVSVGVGPVNALCLRQTLRAGWVAGLAAGAGALVADTLYGTAAVFGLSMASGWVEANANVLRLIAAAVLVIISVYLVAAAPRTIPTEGSPRASLAGFAAGFAITLSNPLTILTIAALLAAFGASGLAERQPVWASIGIAVGCGIWWTSITAIAAQLRERFSARVLYRIHIGVAALMLVFAAGLVLQAAGIF